MCQSFGCRAVGESTRIGRDPIPSFNPLLSQQIPPPPPPPPPLPHICKLYPHARVNGIAPAENVFQRIAQWKGSFANQTQAVVRIPCCLAAKRLQILSASLLWSGYLVQEGGGASHPSSNGVSKSHPPSPPCKPLMMTLYVLQLNLDDFNGRPMLLHFKGLPTTPPYLPIGGWCQIAQLYRFSPSKGGYRIFFSFCPVGPVGHNIWWRNSLNGSFGPKKLSKFANLGL